MLHIERNAQRPMFEQIYSHYVNEILKGNIRENTVIPPTRKLAEELGVSRNTVMKAYDQLQAEGYIESVQGSGFRVLNIPVLDIKENIPIVEEKESVKNSYRYDFIYGSLDNDDIPYAKWLECYKEAVYAEEMKNSIGYADRQGRYELREEICRYLYEARGVSASPKQVIVMNGLQFVMEMLTNITSEKEKTFAMEDPGYDGIRIVMKNRGYDILPVPVEKNGIDTGCLKDLKASFLYLTPSNQFPLGGVLPVAKRMEVIAWAEEKDAYIIEDDYYSELRYYTNPVPAIKSMDYAQRVIYTGTFSKSLSPSMRVTYAVLPESLLQNYENYYYRYHSSVNDLHEKTLALFMKKGYYEQHINRIRTKYRKKIGLLTDTIKEVFGDSACVIGGEAGIHTLLQLKTDLTQEELVDLAEEKGIRVYTTRQFYADKNNSPDDQLLIGFPTVPENSFKEVFTELKTIWRIR